MAAPALLVDRQPAPTDLVVQPAGDQKGRDRHQRAAHDDSEEDEPERVLDGGGHR